MKTKTPLKYEIAASDMHIVCNTHEKISLANVLDKKGILSIDEISEIIKRLKEL